MSTSQRVSPGLHWWLGVLIAVMPVIALLAGCDQPASKEMPPATPPAANNEFGRWMVAAASTGPQRDEVGAEIWSAWRLDTKTGDLEFCTYRYKEQPTGSQIPAEDIGCTRAARAIPSD